jgi:flavin-dependent dehydrogenase
MDLAALSGRLAVKAIKKAEKTSTSPIEHYQRFMGKTVKKMESNEQKQTQRYATNESLEKSLSSTKLLRDGLLMVFSNQINRILPAEKVILLPT